MPACLVLLQVCLPRLLCNGCSVLCSRNESMEMGHSKRLAGPVHRNVCCLKAVPVC